jgi:hypothetical protein
VTQPITAPPKIAHHHRLDPVVVVTGVLLIAVTAKFGHGMWGISLLLAFYPSYLAILAAHRGAASALARLGLPRIAPPHAHARVPATR